MKIAVMGAGAVGCYFGGMLARSGHEVTLVARPEHVEAIRRSGLLMETLSFCEHVRIDAGIEASAVAHAELVLFCVKSIATESAGASLAPLLAAGCTLVSLQNGVDNAERLQAVAGHAALAAVVRVAVEMVAPGHICHRGGGELTLADGEPGRRLAPILRAAGIAVRLSDNLPGEQWTKLVVNCALNALSAIAQKPFGPLLQVEGVQELIREVVQECLAVARVAGITVAGDPWEALRRSSSQGGQFSSMAQDHARGRRSEIDHLNGYVVRLGEELGVATPVNRCLQVAVRLIEERARQSH